jgi:5-formyltetrahydrofolate cyclo-ligase
MISKVTLNNKQLLRARLREVSLDYGERDSSPYCETLLNLPEWKNAKTILLYHPLPGEIDVMAFLAADSTKSFLFPRIEGEHLALYRLLAGSRWITNPFGFKEPDPGSWEVVTPKEVHLAIIPGLAFDEKGGRLGRGKGYYDRLLGHPDFQGIKIGLCWPWQLLDSLPCEPHDIRMDRVISV